MTQKELLYITTIAETTSISKAAEKLHIAQPSLSHTLQRIEGDLGVELFKRTADGLKPTIAGEYYLQTAKGILHSYRQLETKLSWLNDMKVGKLVLGTTAFLGSVVLPHILHVFNELYPNVEVTIMEDVSQKVEAAILKGDVDVGVFHRPLSTSAIKGSTLVKEHFLLAVPPGNPLINEAYQKGDSGKKYLDLRLTDHQDYVLTYPEQRTRQRSDHILSLAGVVPKLKYQTKSIQTATRLSGMGLGFTLVPYLYSLLFNQSTMPKLFYIEEEFEPYWELAVCCAKGSLSKPAEELINVCHDVLPAMYSGDVNN